MTRTRLLTALAGLAATGALVAVDRTVVRRRYGAGALARLGRGTTVRTVRPS